MSAVVVNEGFGGAGGGTPPGLAMVGVVGGNALIARVANSSGSTNPFTVSDDKGNTWTRMSQGFQSGGTSTRIEIWAAFNVAAGTTTVTATSAGSSASLTVQEWSGLAGASTLDVANGGGNASSTTAGTVGQTTTNATDLLMVALNFSNSAGVRTATHNNTGGIWTEQADNPSGSTSNIAATAQVSSTGTYSDSWTLSTAVVSGWAFASFKLAGPGGTSALLLGGL